MLTPCARCCASTCTGGMPGLAACRGRVSRHCFRDAADWMPSEPAQASPGRILREMTSGSTCSGRRMTLAELDRMKQQLRAAYLPGGSCEG